MFSLLSGSILLELLSLIMSVILAAEERDDKRDEREAERELEEKSAREVTELNPSEKKVRRKRKERE